MLTMSTEPSTFFTSQVQPDPKLPTAEVWNAFLKSSKLPHFLAIASASAPLGAPPPLGFMLFQKKVWFHTCAELLYMPPEDFLMISSSLAFSNSVPLIRLFRLVT